LQTYPEVRMGTLRDEDLERGITKYLVCWSPTRRDLRVEAKLAYTRDRLGGDPFVVGKPERLSANALGELKKELDLGGQFVGQVLCGYRIPVTLRPRAPDGKTPVDLGPFRRWVTISSPDVPGEPKTIPVGGRVRGLVEIGSDDETAVVNLRNFRGSQGKRDRIYMNSNEPGLKIEFDRKKTPEFLNAKVTADKATDGNQSWEVLVEVLPNKASGPFPRKEDPLYEDSGIYLTAQLPGKPPRSIRIAVTGTASAN
jgi:hypothetical protein